MSQSFATIPLQSKLLQPFNKSVFDTLMAALICILLAWYAQYHWKRRKLYQMAAQRKGPLTLPFIGSLLYFLGSTTYILTKLLRLSNDFESPVPVWFGQQLFYVIWKPKDMETLLNSPHALKKNEMYRFVACEIGQGLLTAPVPKWKRHRKYLNPTFNQKILDGFVATFSEQAEVLVQQLKREAGKGIFDVFNYVSRCSLDIICETIIGITVNAQTTGSDYFKWINNAMEVVFMRLVRIFYHPDFIFNRTSMGKELHDDVKKMNEFTAALVRDKRAAYRKKVKENRERPAALIEEESKNVIQKSQLPKQLAFIKANFVSTTLIQLQRKEVALTDSAELIKTFEKSIDQVKCSIGKIVSQKLKHALNKNVSFKRLVEVPEILGGDFNDSELQLDLDIISNLENAPITSVEVERSYSVYKHILSTTVTECVTYKPFIEHCNRKPFLQQLIELSEEGSHLTDQDILDEVKVFMTGGTDSTSSTESFVFTMLGMFPDIQHKVYKEVMDVLGPDRPVEISDLGKLQYLERVIKETLRIFPIGLSVARTLTEDIELESCTIPAGSSVLLLFLAAHRDPSVWPNPLKFDPDRFLPEEVAKRHPYSWLPFSGGPRNCIGLKFAMMALKVVIATVIRRYRCFTDYKNIEDIKLKAAIFLKPVDGYKVSVELRE